MKRRPVTIILLIAVGVLIAVQGVLGNIAAEQFKEWLGPWARYVPFAFLLITAGLIGYAVRDQLAGVLDARSSGNDQQQAEQHRQAMLAKVRLIWIDGVLTASLYRETAIMLSMQPRPQAVTPPRGMIIQRTRQADQPLPPDTHIVQVFDAVGEALLILGAPGAGKTTLLLELARDLLDRATEDGTLPMPVVFPLSSWAERRLPLDEWLVDELSKRYDVGRSLAHAWIDADAVLPLLDGLDEVAPIHRSACVEAINTYRQAHGLLPLVVSSRSADYDKLTVKLRLHGAIVVQPLTRDQVKAYLQQIGLRVAPSSTSPLWDLLDTPLMLNIATLTYAGQDVQDVSTEGTTQEQRQRLFTAYVERMFDRRPASQRFSQSMTLYWLSWLAWQMQQHNETVLYLEHLQPEWLPIDRARWQYALLDRMGFGLVVGLAIALIVALLEGLLEAGLNWMFFGLFAWLLAGLFGGVRSQYWDRLSDALKQIRSLLLSGLGIGLLGGLLSGFIFGLETSLIIGLLFAIFGAPVGALVGKPHIQPRRIILVEALHWSWDQAQRSMFTGICGGLAFGIASWPALMLFSTPNEEIPLPNGLPLRIFLGLISALFFGMFICIPTALFMGLLGGLTNSRVEQNVRPNQGIWRSTRNALMIGLAVGLSGLPVGIMFGLGGGVRIGLALWMSLGLMSGLSAGLAQGGYACLSHTALRLVLWHQGAMPLAYVRFLDENAQRILLRKVGGGYSFMHRMLLDYFAQQYHGPETIERRTGRDGT